MDCPLIESAKLVILPCNTKNPPKTKLLKPVKAPIIHNSNYLSTLLFRLHQENNSNTSWAILELCQTLMVLPKILKAPLEVIEGQAGAAPSVIQDDHRTTLTWKKICKPKKNKIKWVVDHPRNFFFCLPPKKTWNILK